MRVLWKLVFLVNLVAYFCNFASAQYYGSVISLGEYSMGANMNCEYKAVASSLRATLAIKRNGDLVGWGRKYSSTSGSYEFLPTNISDFVAVDGYYEGNYLGLKNDSSIVQWGHLSSFGSVPAPNTNYTAVAAGYGYFIALREDSSVVTWGVSGALGLPPGVNSNFTAIAAGIYHALALKKDGSVVAWGSNADGQLNIPSPNTNFIAIAAGNDYSVGLKKGGSIIIWGNSNYTNLPPNNSNFVDIKAISTRRTALRNDGSVYCWSPLSLPSNNTDFVAISADAGLKKDGTIDC